MWFLWNIQVTHLVIKRPPFFHFKPGDYVYLNIPAIAKYEWHPFTISSAPEQQGRDRLSFKHTLTTQHSTHTYHTALNTH